MSNIAAATTICSSLLLRLHPIPIPIPIPIPTNTTKDQHCRCNKTPSLLQTLNPNANPSKHSISSLQYCINITSRRELLVSGAGAVHLLIGVPAVVASIAAPSSSSSECPLTVTPSGLAYCDRVVGTGAEVTRGQLIKAHYVGSLENGKVFDSSYDRRRPLTFRIGVGEVIKGWDQGILGGGDDAIPPMLAGGKRTLKIPPELGYGMRGAGCSKGGSCIIPPDATLLFDVEFIGKAT